MKIEWIFVLVFFTLGIPIIFLDKYNRLGYLFLAELILVIIMILLFSQIKKMIMYQREGNIQKLLIIQKRLSIFYTFNYENFNDMYIFSKTSTPRELLMKMEEGRKVGYFRSNRRRGINGRRMAFYWFYSKMEEIAYYMIYGSETLDQFVTERKKDCIRVIRNEWWAMHNRKRPNYKFIKNAFQYYLSEDYKNAYEHLKRYCDFYFGDNKAILIILMYVCALKLQKNIQDDISPDGSIVLDNALKNDEFKQFILRETEKKKM